jgi:peptidoglycan/LPS O-acetylase OafA/YrhL
MDNKFSLDVFNILRFVASILVIRQHTGFLTVSIKIFNFEIGHYFFSNLGAGGQAIIFFLLLSSFIITKNFLNNYYKLDFSNILIFYLKRFLKIYPLYFLVVTISIFLFFPFVIQNREYSFFRDLYLMNYFYQRPFNQIIWFIPIEFLYYLTAPFIVIIFNLLLKLITNNFVKLALLSIFFLILLKFIAAEFRIIKLDFVGFYNVGTFFSFLNIILLGVIANLY